MLKKILFALGLLIFLFGSIVSLSYGSIHFGTIVILGFSCVLILYGLFYEKLTKIKWLTYSVLALCTSYLIMMVFIGYYGKTDNVSFNEDDVIVLGAGINGEQVPRLLAHRLDKAVEYSANNPNAVIVVSGGQGPKEDITEALAMERYLVDKGVSKEKIIKEEASTSTHENLLYSKKILDELFESSYETVVITNEYHIYRATKLAEKIGLSVTHYNAKIEWDSVPFTYSKECIAILKTWLFGI